MEQKIRTFDSFVIFFLRKYSDEIARGAFFLIFFWFGALKALALSPAEPLVVELLQATFLGWIDPDMFVQWFGIFEMLIGVLILFPRLARVTTLLLVFHMFTTIMPLFVIPEHAWDGFLQPNLTGQYIIKNVVLIAAILMLFARLKPIGESGSIFAEEEKTISIN